MPRNVSLRTPQVDNIELDKFYREMQREANRRFGKDEDNDPRVEVQVLDRTRFQGMNWFPVPYDHRAASAGGDDTEEERRERIRAHRHAVNANLQMAAQALDLALRLEHFDYLPRPEVREDVLRAVEAALGEGTGFWLTLPGSSQRVLKHWLAKLRQT